jgi:soluble lytic murein transglycosylase-like protein
MMQIMPYNFENFYVEGVNKKLAQRGREKLFFNNDSDRFNVRSNIILGSYIFYTKVRYYKSYIWAAMSYNLGPGGVKKAINIWKSRENDNRWFCKKISNVRFGRQFSYSYKYAKRSGRLREWNKMFGSIPNDAMDAFLSRKGGKYCERTK